jgi:threonine dehydrogenase-like Zn-dependent dehydrogenase
MMEIRELWHTSPEKSQIITKNFNLDDQTKILVKTAYTLVSTGTERLVSKGQVPEQLWQSMKVQNMEGSFAFPLKYGYSLVGEVIDGDKNWIGKHVHLMNPHQDFAFVSPEQVSLIPYDVPIHRAVLASVIDTAVNAVWDSGISIGDKVLVNGFGIIGALITCIVSQIPGVNVLVREINAERQKNAESMGFELLKNNEEENFDGSFNASSSGEGLQFCLDKTGYEGTIVEMSWFGTGSVELKLGTNFHIRRQRIISSQVSQIPGFKLNRWDLNRRKALVFELLKNPIFDILLKKQVPFSKATETFDSLRQGNMSGICITFNYL